jgi:hypothetical protein
MRGRSAVMAKTARRRSAKSFYEEALSEAERASTQIALEVEGVDEELAMLRLRLRSAVKAEPKDLALMLRGIDALRRLVETRHRLGEDQTEALAAEIPLLREALSEIAKEVAHDGDPGNR